MINMRKSLNLPTYKITIWCIQWTIHFPSYYQLKAAGCEKNLLLKQHIGNEQQFTLKP